MLEWRSWPWLCAALFWLQPFYDPELSTSLQRNWRRLGTVIPREKITPHFSLNKSTALKPAREHSGRFPGAGQAFKAVEANSQVRGSSGDCFPADTHKHEDASWAATSKCSRFPNLLSKEEVNCQEDGFFSGVFSVKGERLQRLLSKVALGKDCEAPALTWMLLAVSCWGRFLLQLLNEKQSSCWLGSVCYKLRLIQQQHRKMSCFSHAFSHAFTASTVSFYCEVEMGLWNP